MKRVPDIEAPAIVAKLPLKTALGSLICLIVAKNKQSLTQYYQKNTFILVVVRIHLSKNNSNKEHKQRSPF